MHKDKWKGYNMQTDGQFISQLRTIIIQHIQNLLVGKSLSCLLFLLYFIATMFIETQLKMKQTKTRPLRWTVKRSKRTAGI